MTRATGPRTDPCVSVVHTLDELMQVVALRAQVYMSEQNCPYREEFDGNDLAGATHILAHIGSEPIGAMRIRWFGDFAKFERMCVHPIYRGGQIAVLLFEFGAALAARKGFKRALAHANERVAPHWERVLGMRKRPERARFTFSGIGFVEVERELPANENALSINSAPLVLVRPEGAWDDPGVLETAGPGALNAGRRQ